MDRTDRFYRLFRPPLVPQFISEADQEKRFLCSIRLLHVISRLIFKVALVTLDLAGVETHKRNWARNSSNNSQYSRENDAHLLILYKKLGFLLDSLLQLFPCDCALSLSSLATQFSKSSVVIEEIRFP